MTIACKICGHKLHSQLPLNQSQAHVLEQMTRHLAERHKDEAQDLAAIIAATSTYLLIRRYVEIPAQETDLQKNFELNEQTLFEILEVDPQDTQLKAATGGSAPGPPPFNALTPKIAD